jgi:hypothetical protein
VKRPPILALRESFICFRCSRSSCIDIHGYDCIDVLIIPLYSFEVEIEKIGGGDLTAPNFAYQLYSGFEMDSVPVLSRFAIVLPTAKESTDENDDST